MMGPKMGPKNVASVARSVYPPVGSVRSQHGITVILPTLRVHIIVQPTLKRFNSLPSSCSNAVHLKYSTQQTVGIPVKFAIQGSKLKLNTSYFYLS